MGGAEEESCVGRVRLRGWHVQTQEPPPPPPPPHACNTAVTLIMSQNTGSDVCTCLRRRRAGDDETEAPPGNGPRRLASTDRVSPCVYQHTCQQS